MKRSEKGFTLMELLVVVAIIGILAAIVIVSLNRARNKGKDAAIKTQLQQMRAASEMYNDDNGSYTGWCGSAEQTRIETGATTAGGTAADCDVAADGSAWAAEIVLLSGGYWCVDSNGASKAEAASKGAAVTACP